ncbi:MAG: hypothetical protein ACKO57_03740 [Alphaproteobacteria bacterium]
MIFEDDTDALALVTEDPPLRRALSFHLLTCSLDELKHHFGATFQKVGALRACGYSDEITEPYARALVFLLLELRVRGYEADYNGNIYKSPVIVPVPATYPSERERQKHRLLSLDTDFFRTLYGKTLQMLRGQVKKESKALSL